MHFKLIFLISTQNCPCAEIQICYTVIKIIKVIIWGRDKAKFLMRYFEKLSLSTAKSVVQLM